MSTVSPSATRRAGAGAILARAILIVATLAVCLVPRRAWSQAAGAGDRIGDRISDSAGTACGFHWRASGGDAAGCGRGRTGGGVSPAGRRHWCGGRGRRAWAVPEFACRFLWALPVSDPRAESRWAPYLVAGGSFRADAGTRGRLYALGAVGAEGPASHPIVPAFELGFGGGVRAGVVLRRGMATRR